MSFVRVWLIVLLAVAAPGFAQAKWLVAESPKFLVYGKGDPDGLRDYAEKLELYDAVLRKAHGMDPLEVPPRKLPVYLVPTAAGLRQVVAGLSPHVVGFYAPSRGDIFAMAVRSRDPDQVVLHEYAHHFMLQYFPSGYPAWLVEGYAEYFSSAQVKPDRISLGMPNHGRAYRILEADWIPTEQVLAGVPRSGSPEDRSAFYAQSWAMTHWFMSDKTRQAQLQRYLAMVAVGKPSVESMIEATGAPIATLHDSVERYSQGRLVYPSYLRTGFKIPAVTVTEMPESWDDLLLPHLAMRKGMAKADGAALLEKTIRPEAAKAGNDRFAHLALAYGELWYGEGDAAERLLQGMLAADAKDADALQLLGILRVNKADRATPDEKVRLLKEAQGFLARSHAARGDDYRTLLYYARARRLEPAYPSDNTLNIVTLAYDLAPQVSNVRMLYAEALIRRKQWPEARAILLPIANGPHASRGAAQARRLLVSVDAQIGKGSSTAAPAVPVEDGAEVDDEPSTGPDAGSVGATGK